MRQRRAGAAGAERIACGEAQVRSSPTVGVPSDAMAAPRVEAGGDSRQSLSVAEDGAQRAEQSFTPPSERDRTSAQSPPGAPPPGGLARIWMLHHRRRIAKHY